MMNNNLFLKVLWVILYALTFYYTFTNQMMIAMYFMAGTMFAQSIVDLVYYFIQKKNPKSASEMNC
ncbi:Putative uncharacterized protein [Lactobacillus equicursoris DSM 19284 = JCM 14600 = CIP 110162]|uniref:Uncharacterized protein n=1 Tax=Lactobacillus equicursoris DSM 19284 = JCM 14600 = CIP 110162 TaxID=1293597 RepID=K0NME7_9LACO|nr:hypothetical protein [Lactobacillus equicursoris]KRL02007.1 hypothetical protein FC20_GL000466 [Lactobacillus equicursoris DSM 19284 = JCM 14600 = CIP 110162]CCK86116.1 Putative uncharacterized protein [Lactobacillus equicursoris DSM 19284 = JCM 14600 = CIP 110162]CCK86607.1 Putative uncharacterized protein [Lactobacillus equicursoris DSM 19284 = JCM 14600 = CIP 110162]